jgi:hypothetical protein
MGTTECTRLPSLLVSGEERHADPIAANCHLTNRVAVVTSRAVREKGGLRPTVISTIKRAESVLFSDFCGCGPPSAFVFEIPSGNPGWSGGLGAGLPCFCKLDPRSRIPRVAFLRLFHEKAQHLTKPLDTPFDKSDLWV